VGAWGGGGDNMKTPEEKYKNDPQYKKLVDMLYHMIVECRFTPSELREAATFASIKYEMQRVKQMKYPPPDNLDKSLTKIHNWTKESHGNRN
jgi:hypothetical protein